MSARALQCLAAGPTAPNVVDRCQPGAVTVLLDGAGLLVDPEQVQPAAAHQLTHDVAAPPHRVDARARRLYTEEADHA